MAGLSLVTDALSAIFVEKEVEAEDRHNEKDPMHEIRQLRREVADLRQEIKARDSQTPH